MARADCYWGYGPEANNAQRAEEILKRGLAVPQVAEREQLLERLYDLYEETARTQEAATVRRERERLNQLTATSSVSRGDRNVQMKETVAWGAEGLPVSEFHQAAGSWRGRSLQPALRREHVGRNEPCPCGSGKKFKRCCGGR